jgi:hypothetical protein
MHRIVLSVMALALLLVVASVSPVAADGMFVVDSEADASDQNPGDGQCATTDDTCTVRAAIEEANALEDTSTITIPAGTYVLSSSLVISQSMTLIGTSPDATILDANQQDRVITVGTGGTEGNSVSDVSITGLTVRGGEVAAPGGGMLVYGDVLLDTVVITGNTTLGGKSGGGLVVTAESSAVITNSTIANNTGAFRGGGIATEGSVTMTNSTVSGNTDTGGGGGISLGSGSSLGGSSALTVTHVTFAFNTGAIDNRLQAPVRLQNTLLADIWSSGSPYVTSLGGNVSVSNNLGLDQPSDLFINQPAEAFVAPLADNGGATPTHLLTAGSPARDVVSGTCLPTDQRGETRPQGPGCDSGAVEMPPVSNQQLFLPLLRR